MTNNPDHRHRRGQKLTDTQMRDHCISTRVNAQELEQIDSWRGTLGMQRGEYLRAAVFNNLPHPIPAINQEAWVALDNLRSTFTQYQHAIKQGTATCYPPGSNDQAIQILDQVRNLLIGLIHK
jgi:hypothetical protein